MTTLLKTRENTLDKYVIKEQSSYLKKIKLSKDDIWLDAGANIGAFAVRISNDVKKVICYEPDLQNFELLKQNTDKLYSLLKNVTSVNKALVSNDDKKREFFLNKKLNKGAHSFLVKRGRDKIVVNCENINEVLLKYNINNIKMDVEGAEEELLNNIDFSNINQIIFEYHRVTLKDMQNVKYNKLINKLKSIFFVVNYKQDPKKAWTTIVYCKK